MASQFDDLPVNQNNAFKVSEFQSPDQEDQQLLKEMQKPVADRLADKNWKIRLKTYEQLVTSLSTHTIQHIITNNQDNLQQMFPHFGKQFTTESNPNVLEKAIHLIAVFFQFVDQTSLKQENLVAINYSKMIQNIIEKGVPGKPQLKKQSLETLVNIFEKMVTFNKTVFIESLLKCMNNKNVKIQAASVQVLIELIDNFGIQHLENLKEFFPIVEKLSQSTNQQVKTECVSFYKQVYGWMGTSVTKIVISNLKKNQQEEIEQYMEQNKNIQLSAKRIEQQQEQQRKSKVDQIEDSQQQVQQQVKVNNQMDPYDILDAQDISGTFSEKWCTAVINASKWSEKKNLLVQLAEKIEQSVKVNPNCQTAISNMLKKLYLKESNINVLQQVIRISGLMSRSIRSKYKQAKTIVPYIFDKLGDKKTFIQEESQNSLKNMLYNIELLDVCEQLLKVLNESKNGQVLKRILMFVQDYVEMQGDDIQKIKSNYGSVQKGVEKMQENGNMEVREQATKIVNKMLEIGIDCETEQKNAKKYSKNERDKSVEKSVKVQQDRKLDKSQEKRTNKSQEKGNNQSIKKQEQGSKVQTKKSNESNQKSNSRQTNRSEKVAKYEEEVTQEQCQVVQQDQKQIMRFEDLEFTSSLKNYIQEGNKRKIVQELICSENMDLMIKNYQVCFDYLFDLLNQLQDINSPQFHQEFLNVVVKVFEKQEVVLDEDGNLEVLIKYILNRMGDLKYKVQVQNVYKYMMEMFRGDVLVGKLVECCLESGQLSNKQIMDLNYQLRIMVGSYGDTVDCRSIMQYVSKYIANSGLTKMQIKEIHNLVVQLANYFGKNVVINQLQKMGGQEADQIIEKVNQSKELSDQEKKCSVVFRAVNQAHSKQQVDNGCKMVDNSCKMVDNGFKMVDSQSQQKNDGLLRSRTSRNNQNGVNDQLDSKPTDKSQASTNLETSKVSKNIKETSTGQKKKPQLTRRETLTARKEPATAKKESILSRRDTMTARKDGVANKKDGVANKKDGILKKEVTKKEIGGQFDVKQVAKLLKDTNWEKRKKGLEQVEQFCSCNNGQLSGLNNSQELINTFIEHLLDPHKQLQKQFIMGVDKLVQKINIKQYCKNIMINLMSILGDKNKELRQIAFSQVQMISEQMEIDKFMTLIYTYLLSDNNMIKESVISLIDQNYEYFHTEQLKQLFILNNDKNKGIREQVETLIWKLIDNGVVNQQDIQLRMRDLKKEQQKVVMKYMDQNSLQQDFNTNPSGFNLVTQTDNSKINSNNLTQNQSNYILNDLNDQSESLQEEPVLIESIIQLQYKSQAYLMKQSRQNDKEIIVDDLYIEELQTQMQAIINQKYIRKLFMLQHNNIIELSQKIIVSCVEEGDYIYLVSDLVAKWVLLVVYLMNDKEIIDKGIEVVKYLLILFNEKQKYFTSYETRIINNILNYYVNKIKQRMSQAVQILALLLQNTQNQSQVIQYWVDRLCQLCQESEDQVQQEQEYELILLFVTRLFEIEQVCSYAKSFLQQLSNFDEIINNETIVSNLQFYFDSEILQSLGYKVVLKQKKMLKCLDLQTNFSMMQEEEQNDNLDQFRNSYIQVNNNFMVDEDLDVEQLENLMKVFKYEIKDSSISKIVDSLMSLTDLAQSDYEKHIETVKQNGPMIYEYFGKLLANVQQNRRIVTIQLMNYIFLVFDKLIVLKNIAQNLTIKQYQQIYSTLIVLLVDEQKFKMELLKDMNQKEIRKKLQIKRQRNSEHNDRMDNFVSNEHFARNYCQILQRTLQFSNFMNSINSILNQLIQNHESQIMDEQSELVYYKLLFKYNAVYSNKIDYDRLLIKLDQILILIDGLEKYKNYRQLIKTMANNIIVKCSYYKAKQDKQNYKSDIKKWIQVHLDISTSFKDQPLFDNKEQVHKEIDSILGFLYKDPENSKFIEKLFGLLGQTNDKQFFEDRLDQNKDMMFKEYIISELQDCYYKKHQQEFFGEIVQSKKTKAKKKRQLCLSSKEIQLKIKWKKAVE